MLWINIFFISFLLFIILTPQTTTLKLPYNSHEYSSNFFSTLSCYSECHCSNPFIDTKNHLINWLLILLHIKWLNEISEISEIFVHVLSENHPKGKYFFLTRIVWLILLVKSILRKFKEYTKQQSSYTFARQRSVWSHWIHPIGTKLKYSANLFCNHLASK